jgi:hypothetical protein
LIKKVLNICLLLFSLVGCSNNLTNSTTCSCVKNPVDCSTKLTFQIITDIYVEDIVSITGGYYYSSLLTEIRNEKFEDFYNCVNQEYTKIDNEFLEEKFNYNLNIYETYIWHITVENKYYSNISLFSAFDEDKNYYFIISGRKQSYISSPISSNELNFQ